MFASLLASLLIGFPPAAPERPVECLLPADPDYYRVELVTTRKVPGARLATGHGAVTYAASPFGVSISPEGSYRMNIDIQVGNVRLDGDKELVAWVTTPNLDQIERFGALDVDGRVSGQTDFNKFLLVVTLEPKGGQPGPMWTGPVVVRGMSRSGLMHTMAGHGPFETEPCAVYGY
ncbi:MAG: hypothetical protein O3C45_06665 [Bacteroidetes bacterium]|nr:hypothetical protein [Bacteroidota bacterium]MDA0874730.1 hypothetical protein [Bacteroidota bacterium]